MLVLEAAVSAISYIALAAFFGQLVVAGFLLPQGQPTALRRSLLVWATASLILFLLISMASLILQGSKLQRGGFPSGHLLWHYLTLTQSGQVWLGREIYGALMALLMALLLRNVAGSNLLRAAALFALPLVASRSLASHAVAVRKDTALAVSSDALHLIATALWAGGLLALWHGLRFVKLQGGKTTPLASAIVRRFSVVALASVPALLLTGLYQSWLHVGSLPTLVTTDYGNVMLVKIVLFSLMLTLGAINFFSTKPLLGRADKSNWRNAIQTAAQRVGWEGLLGLAIFGATGLLTLLPPGVHAVHQTSAASANTSILQFQPAEGASVRILSPKPQQIFAGDSVPLKFELTRGKLGHHVHAYVDGQLMGMFESDEGTLNGIPSGRHTLELRVVAADHQTELDAQDRIEFIIK